jgi:hypothetical protein
MFTPTSEQVFSLIVPTLSGKRRAPNTLLSQFCMHFIDRRCQWCYNMRKQADSILRRAIAVGEAPSKLGILSKGPPLSLFDMLLATRGNSGT